MRDFIALLRGSLFTLYCRAFKRNISIGRGLRIYKRLSVTGPGRVEIGRNCSVFGMAGDSSQYTCLHTIDPGALIIIGENARLYAARINARFEIRIGNGVLMEEAGIIDTDFHSIEKDRAMPADEKRDKCAVTLGDGVSVGSRSFIMKGVSIGDRAGVLPGSIVLTDVKAGSKVAGNPAKALQ